MRYGSEEEVDTAQADPLVSSAFLHIRTSPDECLILGIMLYLSLSLSRFLHFSLSLSLSHQNSTLSVPPATLYVPDFSREEQVHAAEFVLCPDYQRIEHSGRHIHARFLEG